MPKLAQTLYETGPDDSLVTADAYVPPSSRYAIQSRDTPNSAVDSRGNVRAESVQSARSASVSGNDLARAISAGLTDRDGRSTQRRASRATGSTAAYTSLSSSIQDDILYELSGGALGRSGDVTTTIGGVERQLTAAQLDDANGITNFLVALTGNSALAETLDVAGQAATFNAVLKKAIDLGAVDVIDTLWERSKDKKRARQMLISSLRYLAITSNLEGVRKVIGYVGRHEALSREPELIRFIMTFYRFPRNIEQIQPDYNTWFTELKSTLDLIEANWYRYQRDGTWITSLEPFTYASPDALTLFRREPDWRHIALTAPAHRSAQLVALARRNYPLLAVL